MAGRERFPGVVEERLTFMATRRYGLSAEEAASILAEHHGENGALDAGAALAEIRRRGASAGARAANARLRPLGPVDLVLLRLTGGGPEEALRVIGRRARSLLGRGRDEGT